MGAGCHMSVSLRLRVFVAISLGSEGGAEPDLTWVSFRWIMLQS